jgi:adenylate cyclase
VINLIRLITGLVLFFYVTSHLLNHSLGLVSYQSMEEDRQWFLWIWRNPLGTTALYGSLLIHFLLGFWALYRPRRLWLPPAEATRVLLGIAIPILLSEHVIGTRAANIIAWTNDTYAYVLLIHFKYAPNNFYIQTAALLAAWTHGCMGLHYWLRLKPWYGRLIPALTAMALVIPILAFLGYISAGREVLLLAQSKAWLFATRALIELPSRAEIVELTRLNSMVWMTVTAALAITLLARFTRLAIYRHRGIVQITYPTGDQVTVRPGTSILKASLVNHIPHASACGGRGRCSTCRVRIVSGMDAIPAPGATETRVLERIGAPPHVRLACQARPTGDVEVIPLLPPDATAADGVSRPAHLQGEERDIVVMFVDMRDFTGLSKHKLPYDVVFILNRYFAAIGKAVEDSGGQLDKFIGDGVMALFGIEEGANTGSCQALDAARRIGRNLDELNRALADDIKNPLRIGIGIHAGPAIVGELGYGQTPR